MLLSGSFFPFGLASESSSDDCSTPEDKGRNSTQSRSPIGRDTRAPLGERYSNVDAYRQQANAAAEACVAEGWLLPCDRVSVVDECVRLYSWVSSPATNLVGPLC